MEEQEKLLHQPLTAAPRSSQNKSLFHVPLWDTAVSSLLSPKVTLRLEAKKRL
ncbi:hypothetical protein CCACVL1_25470 [Corchorus capsularis]|uniref:Uncharacterized protein n=1 Tax=Corchorus capsularis TaxID=210143 RepID=A0A1R3GJW3_COCAP|nr:hypothetical protein CCACVL1_25470 [Corchorus capsularis]